MSTRRPAGTKRQESCGDSGEKRTGSMKFGTTSIGFFGWKTSSVTWRRCSETAVTTSDFSIANRVIGRYDRSCPTIVTSVPCSVVTRPSRSGASISRARCAEIACGSA